MGIIRTQTVKGTFYTYLGAVLGLITNIFLLARFFTPEQIGLLSILIAYSLIFAQFANLGFDNVTLRLFPYFRSTGNKHNGFLFLMVIVLIAGTILSSVVFLLIEPSITQSNDGAATLFNEYSFYIIPLIVFTLFFNSFDAYSRVLYKSVRGTFLKEFLQRALIIIAILLYLFHVIGFSGFILAYIISLCLPTVILIFLIARDSPLCLKPEPKFITKDFRNNIITVSLFGIITVFSSTIIINIDRIMIESFLDLAQVGIYSITFYFGVIITMPSRALSKISSTIVAEAWKNNDIKLIKDVYYKSCLNQMIFSALLFIGIWANIDNIFCFLNEKYIEGKYVILWVCIGSFIDMSTGINSAIIGTSKYYKMQSLFMLIFVITIIITNYFLIPEYGITGAAVANAISLLLFNFLRWFFIWNRFGLQPFTPRYLLVIVFALAAYFAGYALPAINPYYIDVFIRSFVILAVYGLLIYFTGLSEDINNRINFYLSKLRRSV